jgi:hypothetical protein
MQKAKDATLELCLLTETDTNLQTFISFVGQASFLLSNDETLTCMLQEECFEALESISRKINTNDADMR